jgi:hypothetical protein
MLIHIYKRYSRLRGTLRVLCALGEIPAIGNISSKPFHRLENGCTSVLKATCRDCIRVAVKKKSARLILERKRLG